MKTNRFIARIVLVFLVPMLVLSGCSKKLQSNTTKADVLNYSFSDSHENKYSNVSKVNQLIIVGEQEISADIESSISFSLSKVGELDKEIDLNIKIDSIYGIVKTIQGDMLSNPEEVKGKEFNMKLSTKGKESGLEEAANIKYAGIGGQVSNLKLSFAFLFPDLPTGATGIAYTWIDIDTLDMSSEGQNIQMIMNSKNTIVAKENIGGYDCYKITYSYTGERNASGETPEGFMSSTGSLTGSGYIYFAIKEGKVIQDHSEQKFKGELTVPTGDSFPMYMDIIIDTDLKK